MTGVQTCALPIYLPFLTEKARLNILGGNAARLFGLEPRNPRQAKNLKKARA